MINIKLKLINFLISAIVLTNNAIPTYAFDNTLKFYQDNSNLYYDTSLYNDNIFMNCENMSYNKEYSSYMSIQNLTDTPYTLYLKAVPVEQSKQSEELLKSINLTLSLNDEVIYNGSADGTVYDLNYPELNNSICLGDIIPSDDYVLSATISLNNDYSITDNVSCQVDWVFYASTIDDNNNNNSNNVNYSNTSTSKYNHSNSKRVLPIQAEKYPFKTDDCFNYSIIFVWIFSVLALIRFYPKKQK